MAVTGQETKDLVSIPKNRAWGRSIINARDRCLASTLSTAAIAPLWALALTGVVYLVPINPVLTAHVVIAWLVNLVVTWLVFSLIDLLGGFSKRDRANATSYNLLQSRLKSLQDREIQFSKTKTPQDRNELEQLALKVMHSSVNYIDKKLKREGPQWVTGGAYIALWRLVHEADEASLYLAPLEEAIASAETACLSLTNSGMENEKSQIEKLKKVLEQLRAPAANGPKTPDPNMEARAILSSVWKTIHSYRDDRWDDLRKRRNQLTVTMGLLNILAYLLLGTAILLGVRAEHLQTAAAIYLVGAVVGLLSGLYTQTRTSVAVPDDYGLSFHRLVADPQISGFAAVLGVWLVAMAGAVASGGAASVAGELNDIVDIKALPLNLLWAAGFGLTPGLVFDQLRQFTDEKIKSQLKSVDPADGLKMG